MYSPRIAEDLIPLLYRVAKARRVPMTVLVSEILRRALENERKEMKDDTGKSIDEEPYQQEGRSQ